MSSIEEKRNEKKKEMDSALTINEIIDQPTSVDQESTDTPYPESIKSYIAKFGLPPDTKNKHKSGVFLDSDLLEMVKNTIFYLGLEIPMSSLIENIVREHFESYLELINKEVSKRPHNILPKR